jgi:hypothetical protein
MCRSLAGGSKGRGSKVAGVYSFVNMHLEIQLGHDGQDQYANQAVSSKPLTGRTLIGADRRGYCGSLCGTVFREELAEATRPNIGSAGWYDDVDCLAFLSTDTPPWGHLLWR